MTAISSSIMEYSSIIKGETFEDRLASISSLIASKKNIVVLVGAGISVSCGIPDFRSASGLYNTLNYQVGGSMRFLCVLNFLIASGWTVFCFS